ncbi:hypothetical protein OC861_004665 [Tilletia horrida]|nr:hypothetical protein OC861_004665 [Tilletia horrida]
MEHVPLSLSRASPPPSRPAAESEANDEAAAGAHPSTSESDPSAPTNGVATLAPPPTLAESIHQTSSQTEHDSTLSTDFRQALESAGDPAAPSSTDAYPSNGDEDGETDVYAPQASSSRRRSRDPTDEGSTENNLASLRASVKRFRQVSAPEDDFAGPISVQRDDGLYTTANNPYVMPDLDILASYWSTAARSALRGRVAGLMRFFRLSGYIPPTAPGDMNPDDSQRRRLRVSRGYETWKCRACGIMLNPVCGETGNARKHISLKKCGGLFAPLEEAMLNDKDEEVRKVLIESGARVPGTEAASAAAARANGSTSAVPPGSQVVSSMQPPASDGAHPWFAGVNTGAAPSVLLPSTSGPRLGHLAAQKPHASNLTRPIFQQQADGSTVLIGWAPSDASSNPSSSSSAQNGSRAHNEPVPPIILPVPGQQPTPTFKAPSALAVAAYFLSIGQPAEHADSVPWRHLFDGLPGMPSVQEIREALQGSKQ